MPETITAIKAVKQQFQPNSKLLQMMETFRQMVNDCLRIGLDNNVSTMKKLGHKAYNQLSCYDIMSYYKLCAISHAAGILANRNKSIKRGLPLRQPYCTRPFIVSCYGFKVENGMLKVPLGKREYFEIPLNVHVKKVLSDPLLKIRSFLLTPETMSICYSKQIVMIDCTTIKGVDRNLRNLTVGDCQRVKQYDLSKAVDIAENTRSIVKSFKRNDVRIRKKLYSKYGMRRKDRINQLLHHVSKAIVQDAKQNNTAIVFEDIRRIRQLYQRGNGQGRSHRGMMNSWSFAEIKRLITYKAAWEGIPVIQLSISETRGTSQHCPRCGKKITQVDRKNRQVWCDHCKKWMDRDVVGAMNQSIRGRAFLAKSKDVFERPEGLAGEAVKGNPTMPVILRVDASKLTCRRKPKS